MPEIAAKHATTGVVSVWVLSRTLSRTLRSEVLVPGCRDVLLLIVLALQLFSVVLLSPVFVFFISYIPTSYSAAPQNMARQRFGSLFAFLLYSLVFPFVNSQALTNDQIDQVKTRLAEGARQSWELGTRAQALIEYDVPFYSVLNDTSLPPPQDGPAGQLSEVFSIVQDVVGNRSRSNDDIQGPQPFMQDGSAADPASLGVAVLLANWTGLSSSDGLDYAGAAQDQLNYLLNEVPRTSDGAISHRVSQVQLWSDFVYMVPPFLAYYGVLTDNQTLVREAYNQIKLYRDYLRDDGANGLWKHVLLGSSGNDEGHWSTGEFIQHSSICT